MEGRAGGWRHRASGAAPERVLHDCSLVGLVLSVVLDAGHAYTLQETEQEGVLACWRLESSRADLAWRARSGWHTITC